MAAIGGFRSDLSTTRKPTDGNFGNVSAGVLFSKVAYQPENGGNTYAHSEQTLVQATSKKSV